MTFDRTRGGVETSERLHAAFTVALAAAAVWCGACVRRDDEPPPTYTARDSAGVEIVESRVCAWGASVPWTVTDTAELTIGVASGERPYELAAVTDVLRYPDGRIAVADGGNGEVRIFGPDGRHIRSLGRPGEGPAEFRSLRRILLSQDRLWVYDDRLGRVSAFDESGVLTETRPIAPSGPDARRIGDVRMLSNGDLFGIDGENLAPGPTPSVVRDTAHVFALADQGAAAVITIPGMWTEHREIGGRGAFGARPLTPLPLWDVSGVNVYYSAGDAFEFRVSDISGRPRRIARRLEPAPAVTDADVERWMAPLLAQMPAGEREAAEQVLAGGSVPETLPVYDALLVDPSGDVWVRRFGGEGADWDLYDSRGSCRGTVRMPSGLDVHEIGEDYVLGVWRDENEVARVRLHRLVTEAPPPAGS